MSEVECGDLIKQLILQLKNADETAEQSEEMQNLQERIKQLENAEETLETTKELDDIEKRCEEVIEQYEMDVLENITKEQMHSILSAVTPEFLEEYNIPLSVIDDGFSVIINYIISNIEPGNFSFYNKLLSNDGFTQSITDSGCVLTSLLSRCNDEKIIFDFLNRFSQQFGQADYKQTKFSFGSSNSLFGIAYKTIINSTHISVEFKKKLLDDDNMLFYVSNFDLSDIIKNSFLPKEFKKELLLKQTIFSKLPGYKFSETLGKLCDNYDDYKTFISNDTIFAKIDFAWLFRESSLPFNDLKKLLFDEKVFKKLDWLSLGSILKDVPMSFEERKSLLFDEKIYSKLNSSSIADILSSKLLKPEERRELLIDDRVVQLLIGNEVDPKGSISILLEAKELSLLEKVGIIRDEKFMHLVDDRKLLAILMNPELPVDLATEILFDKGLFYKIIGEYHEQYNPDNTIINKGPYKYDKYEYVKKLYARNPYLAKTFSYELLNDNILDLGFDFIDKISKYPKTARSLADVYNYGDLRYIENMIKVIENSAYAKIMNTEFFLTRIIAIESDKSFYGNDPKRVSLLSKIRYGTQLDARAFTHEQWKTITEIGLRNKSAYYNGISNTIFGPLVDEIDISLNIMPDVETIYDLDNFNLRRLQLCDEIFKTALLESDLDKAKNAYLNKYFNINIQEALEITRMYATSIKDFESNPNCAMQVKYIQQIGKVLSIEKIATINQSYNDKTLKPLTFDETLFVEQSLKHMFGKQISDSVYKVNHDIVNEQGQVVSNSPKYMDFNIEIDGVKTIKKVLVYEPGFDFKMLVHSTAAYGKMELINDNYFDSWNNSSRKSNHGICCSLISNDNMGMAAVNDVLFGFDGWDEKALSKIAPYDIYSANDGHDLQEGRPLTFMSAQDIINHTRHTHNEMVLERFELRDSKRTLECQNIQPSYVIVYSDMTDEIKQKAIKCSLEMKIPIVYLDKEKIIAHEVQKIDQKISDLNATANLDEKIDLLGKILLSHENNRSGLKATNPTWRDQYFPTEKISSVFNQVIAELQQSLQINGDVESYYRLSSKLMDILEEENEKFKVTMETIERKNDIDIPVEEYRMSLMQFVNNSLCKNNVPKLETIVQLDQEKNPDLPLTRALSSVNMDTIHEAVLDIVSKNLYPNDGKNHNIGHIERVIFLSQLIGREELLLEDGNIDTHAMDLLTQAAKYHDCGRQNDRVDKSHGTKSADKMVKFLSDEGYSEDDVKIMQIAVEYHEVVDDDTKFNKLCERYNLPHEKVGMAKKIAMCLKDADALDRTRFKNPNAKLDASMLRTNVAKEIIPTAEHLNRRYERLDKEQFLISCQQLAQQQNVEMSYISENNNTTIREGIKNA